MRVRFWPLGLIDNSARWESWWPKHYHLKGRKCKVHNNTVGLQYYYQHFNQQLSCQILRFKNIKKCKVYLRFGSCSSEIRRNFWLNARAYLHYTTHGLGFIIRLLNVFCNSYFFRLFQMAKQQKLEIRLQPLSQEYHACKLMLHNKWCSKLLHNVSSTCQELWQVFAL